MSGARFKVLLYGKDARTDALAEGLRSSATDCELTVCGPVRSPGLVRRAHRFVTASMTDLPAMVAVAQEVEPDLVVVGPEDPLAAGLADAVGELGIACFGPRRELARLETSKAWTRALLERHGIPGNPAHRRFEATDGLQAYLEELGAVVVKPDGLTGGKGVKVQGEQLASPEEAFDYAAALIATDGSVVIEERLEGEEFSLQTITDGTDVLHCPVAQDHKRAFETDIGPNTGGMGSYSCADGSLPFLDTSDVVAARQINEATIEALAREAGGPYRGVVYGGFMAVADGVRLIEYNARFGDPEAMNVLPLLEGDLVELLRATAAGELGRTEMYFGPLATVCKYVVPDGYPDDSLAGGEVAVDESTLGARLRCYYAATELAGDGSLRLTGSRAIAFVGIGTSVAEAEALAERGARSVSGAVRHRRDIGTAEALDRRVEHVSALRA